MNKKFLAGLLVVLTLGAAGCGEQSVEDQATTKAEHLTTEAYVAKHNIEFRNYNLRQKVADNPSTILWCTFFPPGVQGTGNGSTPGQAFTVPISGKLTSSGKRPFGLGEVGPDGMTGPSSEYRYGFDPTLTKYYDFTNLASFCTTEPTVWQTKETRIVVQTDATTQSLSKSAEAAVGQGRSGEALSFLNKAEEASNKAQGR